jgi:hypothetical protein
MFSRILGLLCIAGALMQAHAPLAAATEPPTPAQHNAVSSAPVFASTGLGKGAIPIDGPWQFHLGDDPAWAAPQYQDATGSNGWEQIQANAPWGAQGHPSYVGFAWYRRHIDLSPAPGASPDFALLIPQVQDAYELYWNGTLIGRNGRMPPNAFWSFFQLAQTFGLGPVRSGVLAVRVWKAPLVSFDNGEQGGFVRPPVIGDPQSIAALKATSDYNWLRRRQFSFGLDSLYGLVVLLSLLAWLRDRRQWLLFWMAGFSLAPLMSLFLLGLPLGISYDLGLGLAQPLVFGLQDISLWFLLMWLLQLHESRNLTRLVRICAVIQIVATSLDGLITPLDLFPHWIPQLQLADAILTGIFTPLEALPLVLVAYAIVRRRHLDLARWLVACFAVTTEMIVVVRIASAQGSRYTHWKLFDKISSPIFTINSNGITAQTLSATLLLICIIFAVYRYAVENSRRQSALEAEFRNARELQQVLVPENLPPLPGFALTSAYRPAAEVGGDFFQIIPNSDGSTLVILGDVSGKGLKAAMAVSLIVGATRMIAEYTTSPAEILAALNRRLYGRLSGGFATAIALRLDARGSCIIASAGHPAPFVNDQEMEIPGALPLGLTAAATYLESPLKLFVGDHFALYTDGLLEARSRAGELYGFARLATLFASRPNATQATDAAVNFGQDDDITVLTLTRLATTDESSVIHSAPRLSPV